MTRRIKSFIERTKWNYVFIFLLITPILGVSLYPVFRIDEILFHSLSEIISTVTIIFIILIVISMWKHIKHNTFISIVSIALMFTGLIDLFHTLSHPALRYFDAGFEGDVILGFWVFSRLLLPVSIMYASITSIMHKKVNYMYVLLVYFIVTSLGIFIILSNTFANMSIGSFDFSTLNQYFEYFIILIYLLSLFLIYKYSTHVDHYILSMFSVFVFLEVISELFFSSLLHDTAYSSFIGHYLEILSSIIIGYILLYVTILSPSKKLYAAIVEKQNHLEKLLKYEKLTREITEICSMAINNDNFVNEVLERLGKTLEVDHTFIYKHIPSKGVFKLSNSWFNASSHFITVADGYEFYVVDSLLDKFKNGETHYSADTSMLEDENDRENFLDIGLYAYINEPVFVLNEFYGFLGYNMTSTNRERMEDDITLIRSVAKIVSQTIERVEAFKEIEYLNHHDDLTSAYNRRYFDDFVLDVDNETNYPLAIVSIDLNGLKLINDAFGHLAGDTMLVKTVELLEHNLDDHGTLFRIGGDEFVILITNTSSDQVYSLFKSIEKQCEKVLVNSVQLSLAYGVHMRTSNITPFYEEFKIAEDEMYRMKLMDVPSMRANAIETILNTLFVKDEYSNTHSNNVSLMTASLAQKMGFNTNQVSNIKMAGLLHDIGKIIVPDHILKKQGTLDHLEYLEIKKHAEIGFRILSSTKDFRLIAEYVLSHHEFFDGNGYPHGKKGKEIPIESRIISVVDAFDAMVSYRSYRGKVTKDEAIEELKRCSGKQFDPEIVKVFIQHIDEITKDIYK